MEQTTNNSKDVGDPETDHTVENAEKVAGGYGGPLPITPEDEKAEGEAAAE